MYGLEPSPLSIEAAWEHSQHHSHPHQHRQLELNHHHSQHSQHTLNLAHPAHQRLESSNQQQHFQFGYSAAFPQYTIPPISPVSPSTSSISSSSSGSSAEPTTPLSLTGANVEYMRRAFGGFNTHSNSAQGIDLDANNCLPTHQLFDFDFAQLAHGGPPSPSLTTSSSTDSHSAPLITPTSPMVSVSVPSNIFSSTDAYDLDGELDDDASPPPRPTPAKRTAGAPPTTTKKARASNSISTKDFVPPDVTGLSKREARLVKNRAAAFLSRQRKREEFELMEIRVAELEQENARLKSLVDNPSSSTSHTSPSSTSPASSASRTSATPPPSPEIEQLRAQLTAARQRENELAERLERVKYQAQREQARDREELVRLRALVSSSTSISTSGSTSDSIAGSSSNSDNLKDSVELSKDSGRIVVKEEEEHDQQSESDTTSSGTSTPANTVKNLLANPRSGASLGLMVLLCALPSLLSSSSSTTSSSLPTASSFLDVQPTFDASSALLPVTDTTGALDWEFDWAGRPRARSASRPSSSASTLVSQSQTSKMDVDHVEEPKSEWTRLEFDSDEAALSDLGLGALDISFETRRAGDGSGRVRVRVHSSTSSPSSSSAPSSVSLSSSSLHSQQNQQNQLSLPTPSREESESDDESEDLGPFLTSTSISSSSSACRSSSHTQSLMEGQNLGFGLNNYNSLNTFGMNDFGMDGMNLGMGMPLPFGTPGYGLDSATATQAMTQTRRRVRIALASLPRAGGEGGEWDVLEVAA